MIEYVEKQTTGHSYIGTMNCIVEAYISGKLEVYNAGTVTYWAQGHQFTPPVTFNENQIMELSQIHGPDLWMEGVSGF